MLAVEDDGPAFSQYYYPFVRFYVLFYYVNPLSPHDALKHHFTSLKTVLIFPQLRVLERKFP